MLSFYVLDVMEAAEKSEAQHRLEKQRCEEMQIRIHKIEEELEELKSDNKRLEPVSMLTVIAILFSVIYEGTSGMAEVPSYSTSGGCVSTSRLGAFQEQPARAG